MTAATIATIDRILEILAVGGGEVYFGEPVTQLEHALQTAALADREGAPDTLVVAALLHDIGHLLPGQRQVPGQRHATSEPGTDAKHERAAARWLALSFGRAVTEPIRLHVVAKRYLCALDPSYTRLLSPASLESLAHQGGPMTRAQAAVFEQTPWMHDALALRRWDDAAKVPGASVPGLDHYRTHIARLLAAR